MSTLQWKMSSVNFEAGTFLIFSLNYVGTVVQKTFSKITYMNSEIHSWCLKQEHEAGYFYTLYDFQYWFFLFSLENYCFKTSFAVFKPSCKTYLLFVFSVTYTESNMITWCEVKIVWKQLKDYTLIA